MRLALGILELVDGLPISRKGKVVTYQIAKSATSVGANYRAACRARSKAEYIAKLQIVLEESDETHYWLQIITRSRMLDTPAVHTLLDEANQLTHHTNHTSCRSRSRFRGKARCRGRSG